jgi:hypothetical protein
MGEKRGASGRREEGKMGAAPKWLAQCGCEWDLKEARRGMVKGRRQRGAEEHKADVEGGNTLVEEGRGKTTKAESRKPKSEINGVADKGGTSVEVVGVDSDKKECARLPATDVAHPLSYAAELPTVSGHERRQSTIRQARAIHDWAALDWQKEDSTSTEEYHTGDSTRDGYAHGGGGGGGACAPAP